jgi:TonB family protein
MFFWVLVYAPDFFNWKSADLPFEVITIQLVGSLEPPAPAAPKAPVNPTLNVPDVVQLPEAEPILPQPTPLENIVIPQTPVEVIPIGKTPVTPPPDVQRLPEPPPRVQIPEKQPEPPPKPKPKRTQPSPDTLLNNRIKELERKRQREEEDQAISLSIANLAAERGRSDGYSSTPAAPNTSGQRIDPEKERYYLQLMEIVRSNWLPPASTVNPNTSTLFVIVIDPSGRVTGKSMRESSGNPDFDASVEQAINRSRFPPLPEIFGGKSDNPALRFNLSYLHSVG